MSADILLALGGVGLFLIGMILMTDGLKALAGRALRDVLTRFTATPVSGAVTGALATATIQSSSATTVTAVGFVSAGLLTFPQALGVIFGANIGTTITGWLVAILGFKLQLGTVVLPLVLVGALLRLFGTPRLRHLGTVFAGFSLLFIGIDAMQAGLAAFEGVVTPASFPDDTLFGRFQLVLIGILITLITQSSSAGVATALAALGAGAISFPQAAAMVIGMDVGTTFTAMLATVGGSTAARRTGFAHVIYNLMTGAMAFVLLGPFAALTEAWVAAGEAQVALVAFHTSFNALGVVAILPFAHAFARFLTRLVPERGPRFGRHLDRGLLTDPNAAVDAALATIDDIVRAQFGALVLRLSPGRDGEDRTEADDDIAAAIAGVRDYVDRAAIGTTDPVDSRRIAIALHLLDHMGRLHYRLTHAARLASLVEDRRLRRLARVLAALATAAAEAPTVESEDRLNRLRKLLRRQREVFRERTIDGAAAGRMAGESALRRLDTVRWLHRVCYHLWRIQHHRARAASPAGRPDAPVDPIQEAALEASGD